MFMNMEGMVKTYRHLNMAINVYEYGRGGMCVYRLTYTHA